MSYDNRKARKARTSEEGIALLTTLFAMLIVTLLGLALTSSGMIEVIISGNARQSTNVLYVADAGLVHAQGIIFSETPDFTALLQTGDGTACNGDELSMGFTVRAGEKLGQERRESGGPWRSKNRPPEICLRKRSQEERFVGYRRDVHSGAICTRSARGLC